MKKILNIIKLMRPNQWIKNFFVFGPILFSRSFEPEIITNNILAFISFCLISSSVYMFNDVIDIENDKKHPKKCMRPLASGAVKIKEAVIVGSLLLIVSISASLYVNKYITVILVIYLFNNILYSFKLKHIVIVDIISIALGFILRVLAGSIATQVLPSNWILLCTFFISLFLGFSKRRNEIIILGEKSDSHRKILSEYSETFLDQIILIVLCCTIIFYSMYAVLGTENRYMVITIIFVAYGIFRYCYLLYVKKVTGGPTEIVTSDKPLIMSVLGWVIACFIILML